MTTDNSVQKKIVSGAMLVGPLILGAIFAFGLGFTAPDTVKAGGDWEYENPTVADDWSTFTYPDDDWSTYKYPDASGDDWSTYKYPDTVSDDWSTYTYPDSGYNQVTADYWNPVTAEYTPPSSSYSYGSYPQPQYYYGGGSNSYVDCSYISGCGSYYTQPSTYTDYVYEYDYTYDYYYEYETVYEHDECTNLPGLQSKGYDCYPDKPHDECSNIKGNQPKGYDCYPDRDEDLECELDVSDTRVEEGDEVTLEWEIDGDATYASINHGIGRVDEDGGEEDVDVDEDTTFRLTVRDNHGNEDTCSVTVRVDEENNFSSIDFEGEPTNNPPQVVYLSSIPYTGLEDIDPALLSYWLMLIAGAGMLGWFLVKNGLVPTFAFASSEPTVEGDVVEAPVEETPTENSFVSLLADDNVDAAIDHLRDAAAHGESIETVLEDAVKAAEGTALESRITAALDASRVNGIRGVKSILG